MATLPVSSDYTITAIYGQTGKLWASGHKGIDFVTADRNVYATSDGVVRVVAFDSGGWGNYLSIGDDAGLRHIFAHLERVLVKEGAEVSAGDVIGIMGKTGNVTGVHLHYQVNRADGTPKNPAEFLGIENKTGSFRQKIGDTSLYKDDRDISAFARTAVYDMKRRGIMVGDKLNIFNPLQYATREELAVVISKVLKEIENGK